jgi:hypothetical protein
LIISIDIESRSLAFSTSFARTPIGFTASSLVTAAVVALHEFFEQNFAHQLGKSEVHVSAGFGTGAHSRNKTIFKRKLV